MSSTNSGNLHIKTLADDMLYEFAFNGELYYISALKLSKTVRLGSSGLAQGFDNIEDVGMKAFCRKILSDKDLHIRAVNRMGNKVNKEALKGGIKDHKKILGVLKAKSLIRFIEGSTCRSDELLRKLKLFLGANEDVLRQLEFEHQSERFKKSLDVFYVFSNMLIGKADNGTEGQRDSV